METEVAGIHVAAIGSNGAAMLVTPFPHSYPQEWTGEKELADALLVTAERLPGARFVITTLGRRGSVMLCRSEEQGQGQHGARTLKYVLADLEDELGRKQGSEQEDCLSRTGLSIR